MESAGEIVPRTLSLVVPVFRGAATIEGLVREALGLRSSDWTPSGRAYTLLEIILVHDCGPDDSDVVLRSLAAESSEVSIVWLARNSGQHAATLAGIAASRGEWVITLDEDGQHDPAVIPELLDAALDSRCHLVYGVGRAPHRLWRRAGSRLAKGVFRFASGGAGPASEFSSFRLILGEIARYVGATAGPWVYLDVALSWSISRVATHHVRLRAEGRPAISYSWSRLVQHFLQMLASLGVRPLSLIFLGGLASGTIGVGFAALTVIQRVTGVVDLPGWSSLMATLLIGFGVTLAAIGIVAAFLGVVVTIMLGRPAYTTVTDDSIVFR